MKTFGQIMNEFGFNKECWPQMERAVTAWLVMHHPLLGAVGSADEALAELSKLNRKDADETALAFARIHNPIVEERNRLLQAMTRIEGTVAALHLLVKQEGDAK